MESPLNDPDLQQLAALSRAVLEMRSALGRVEDARSALVRRLDGQGVNRTLMADVAGVARSRIWQIINPVERLDGHGEIEPDFELLEFADDLWEHAVAQWDENDRAGSPDDYFPVDALLRP